MLTHLEPRVSCATRNSLSRAKDEKRQKRLELDVQAAFFKSMVTTNVSGRSKPLPYEWNTLFFNRRDLAALSTV
jgi:hypothetical protein